LYEVIAERGFPAKIPALCDGAAVSVFDPCASRDFPDMQRSVREIVRMAGMRNEELSYSADKARCCGAGAHTLSANPVLTDIMVRHRIGEMDNPYVNYCTNCRDTFAMWDKSCMHVLDLVFGRSPDEYALPGLGERRRNKLRAKRETLSEFFGEDSPPQNGNEFEMDVIISFEMMNKMRKALILEDEVRDTIEFCERTSNVLYQPGEDSFVGHLQIGLVTFWVEYRKRDGQRVLLNVYSHRMEILEERGRLE
jgi:hypothetical protein